MNQNKNEMKIPWFQLFISVPFIACVSGFCGDGKTKRSAYSENADNFSVRFLPHEMIYNGGFSNFLELLFRKCNGYGSNFANPEVRGTVQWPIFQTSLI